MRSYGLTDFELGEDSGTKVAVIEEAEVDGGQTTEAHKEQPNAERLHRESSISQP